MDKPTDRYHTSPENAKELLKYSNRKWFATVMQHGLVEVEIYIPDQIDLQTVHDRDELYVIIEGRGSFINGDKTHSFEQGDVIFVPAGTDHRFEDFSDNFKTWVIFFGQKNIH
ncbi:MAG: hypothetical protein Kow0098_17900 [Ignavibacteriaceae bacterium]